MTRLGNPLIPPPVPPTDTGILPDMAIGELSPILLLVILAVGLETLFGISGSKGVTLTGCSRIGVGVGKGEKTGEISGAIGVPIVPIPEMGAVQILLKQSYRLYL